MKQKFNNIPIFIPELACPHQCVFCDQKKISDTKDIPKPKDIHRIVDQHLTTIPKDRHINIAFFGGSFTGIPFDLQKEYLREAYTYIESGKVHGIRLSTRPDYINEKILDQLKKYKTETIELGAQSTNNEALRRSGRGHTKEDIVKASEMINEYGFKLGLQMMIGLPGDTHERSVQTAKDIVLLGAENSRIYPTLVIKGTALEQLYLQKKYKPLELDEAVQISKDVYKILDGNNVKVIRTGLHPSEELTEERSLVAGPYHPSFKELVLTEIWKDILNEKLKTVDFKKIIIEVNAKQLNYAIGYHAKNKNELLKHFQSVKFIANRSFEKYEVSVCNN